MGATARMKIELLHTPGCSRCAKAAEGLKAVALHFVGDTLDWHELDVLQHLDYVVQLGVVSPPALAIDGELAFATLPTPAVLQSELRRRLDPQGTLR